MSDPSLGWLAAGFGIAFLLLGGYAGRLWRAQRELQRSMGRPDRKK